MKAKTTNHWEWSVVVAGRPLGSDLIFAKDLQFRLLMSSPNKIIHTIYKSKSRDGKKFLY